MARQKRIVVPKDDFRWSMGFTNEGILLFKGEKASVDRAIEFRSSNNLTKYQAVQWRIDLDLQIIQKCSCNCIGWANYRQCKHIVELATSNLAMGTIRLLDSPPISITPVISNRFLASLGKRTLV